ncbi:uncharacterized protein LOC118488824 [Helianthus annuus]|uniref:uncharacterized protein LOC118488824 n=1 Tax=Helianthus annuus TaxID=4232 RepID=UPI001652EF46|nr:uncharacterized protein LOC118488824 [Helianthus annuus]
MKQGDMVKLENQKMEFTRKYELHMLNMFMESQVELERMNNKKKRHLLQDVALQSVIETDIATRLLSWSIIKQLMWFMKRFSTNCDRCIFISRGQIVLNVASSGIALLLLDGGRTAHSRFSIPLNLTEDSVCNIKPESDLSKLLLETILIIWDKAPMVHKHAFEALNRTMNGVFNIDKSLNSDIRFGGKVIVFGDDFRQILLVVPNGGRQEIVNASLCLSYLWSNCKLLRLTRNMRLTVGRSTADVEEINTFAKWLLDLGDGNVGGPNDGGATIEIPQDLLITDASDPIASLIDFVYPSILENVDDHNYLS